jgi:Mn-dependent DtxR family transcriptional regulator
MGLLKADGYITVDGDGGISLTDSGRVWAEKIYERHHILEDLLIRLGVDPEIAAADACKIEHAISDDSFAAIKRHMMIYGTKKE